MQKARLEDRDEGGDMPMGDASPKEPPDMKMPDPVICEKCGKPIKDPTDAVEMTPFGTDTKTFAHKPIPGCPGD